MAAKKPRKGLLRRLFFKVVQKPKKRRAANREYLKRAREAHADFAREGERARAKENEGSFIPRDRDNGDYELSGYRYKNGDWHDVEAGAPLPESDQWMKIDLVTINLAPHNPEGFYRSANVLGGLDYDDAHPQFNAFTKHPDEFYTLDDLAYEMALSYGFAAQ